MEPVKEDSDNGLFSPSNLNYPVRVFLDVLEYESLKHSWGDTFLMEYAVTQLDVSEIDAERIQSLLVQDSWEEFKAILLRAYDRPASFDQKVDLLQSLAKTPGEDC